MIRNLTTLCVFALSFLAHASTAFAACDGPNRVCNDEFSPPPPLSLPVGERVEVTYDYAADENVFVFITAFSGLDETPSPAGSLIHRAGEGTVTNYFTIESGTTTVDRVRFQMLAVDDNELLFEDFIQVSYTFSDIENTLSNIALSPPSPAMVAFGDPVNLSFDYTANQAVRVFAQPLSGGTLPQNWIAHRPPLLAAGEGSGDGLVSVLSRDSDVDEIRLFMTDDSQANVLLEVFVPVNYQFREAPPPGMFNFTKGKSTLGKKGWKIKMGSILFESDRGPYDGDAAEIRVLVDGVEFFAPASRVKEKIKVDKKTGDVAKIDLADSSGNKAKFDFKKSLIKLKFKGIAAEALTPEDGTTLQIIFADLVGQAVLPTEPAGNKGNKWTLGATTAPFAIRVAN